MTRVWPREAIEKALRHVDVVAAMEWAFTVYSQGDAVVPPVGELLFDQPPGDAHIKYGFVRGDDSFVIKVATGFYENAHQGLPPTSGLMLVFEQRTGLLSSVLLDEGHLTNVRTAAAGAVAAKHLAPPQIDRIGVLGTGQQARLQLDMLRPLIAARDVLLWGRRHEAAAACRDDLEAMGFSVTLVDAPADVAAGARLIVTSTASHQALLNAADIRSGTHITAMGSDTEDKRELASDLLARAANIVADSRSQCLVRGEIHHAVKDGALAADAVVELGDVIAGKAPGRSHDQDITIADLTGVAVQDIAIAKAVLRALEN
jgi:ornithine cyclodeaminase